MTVLGQSHEQIIEEEIKLLKSWVNDTNEGSWSTHLVAPMQRRIVQLKVHLFDYEHRKREDNQVSSYKTALVWMVNQYLLTPPKDRAELVHPFYTKAQEALKEGN